MTLKKIDTQAVATHRFKTSLLKIHEAVGVKPAMVLKELTSQKIEPVSAQVWCYSGFDGKPDTMFYLDICIPVNKKGENTSAIFFNELSEMNCISYVHKGPWSEFGQVYEKLFSQMAQEDYKATGNFREVYLHCDFEDPLKCVTEIQIEIQ